MLGYTYRNQTLRKYVILFGSIFTDMEITRVANTTPELIKVPLSYGPKDRLIAAAQRSFSDSTQAVASVTPRMSFVHGDPVFDNERKTNTLDKIKGPGSTFIYNSVPYNIPFTLSLLTKNVEDGNEIVEQILPFFTPSLTLAMFPIDGNTTYSKEVQIVLNSSNHDDSYQGTFDGDTRIVTWTLQFTLKGYFFGPTQDFGGIIKKININIRNIEESIVIRGGLTSNNTPTTDPTLTIPYNQINKSDNYGFITEYLHGYVP